MADTPNLNYLISVTLGPLKQLRALREELEAIRALAGQPMDLTLNVNAPSLQNLKQQVKQAYEKGAAEAKPAAASRPSGGTTNRASAADINKLTTAINALAGKLEKGLTINGGGGGSYANPFSTTSTVRDIPLAFRAGRGDQLRTAFRQRANELESIRVASIKTEQQMRAVLQKMGKNFERLFDGLIAQIERKSQDVNEEAQGAGLSQSAYQSGASQVEIMSEAIAQMKKELNGLLGARAEQLRGVAANLRETGKVSTTGPSQFEKAMTRSFTNFAKEFAKVGDTLADKIAAAVRDALKGVTLNASVTGGGSAAASSVLPGGIVGSAVPTEAEAQMDAIMSDPTISDADKKRYARMVASAQATGRRKSRPVSARQRRNAALKRADALANKTHAIYSGLSSEMQKAMDEAADRGFVLFDESDLDIGGARRGGVQGVVANALRAANAARMVRAGSLPTSASGRGDLFAGGNRPRPGPMRAERMEARALENALYMEQRQGPGVVLTQGQVSTAIKQLGSALRAIRQARGTTMGTADANVAHANVRDVFRRLREDPILGGFLPTGEPAPGSYTTTYNDLRLVQSRLQDRLALAKEIQQRTAGAPPGLPTGLSLEQMKGIRRNWYTRGGVFRRYGPAEKQEFMTEIGRLQASIGASRNKDEQMALSNLASRFQDQLLFGGELHYSRGAAFYHTPGAYYGRGLSPASMRAQSELAAAVAHGHYPKPAGEGWTPIYGEDGKTIESWIRSGGAGGGGGKVPPGAPPSGAGGIGPEGDPERLAAGFNKLEQINLSRLVGQLAEMAKHLQESRQALSGALGNLTSKYAAAELEMGVHKGKLDATTAAQATRENAAEARAAARAGLSVDEYRNYRNAMVQRFMTGRGPARQFATNQMALQSDTNNLLGLGSSYDGMRALDRELANYANLQRSFERAMRRRNAAVGAGLDRRAAGFEGSAVTSAIGLDASGNTIDRLVEQNLGRFRPLGQLALRRLLGRSRSTGSALSAAEAAAQASGALEPIYGPRTLAHTNELENLRKLRAEHEGVTAALRKRAAEERAGMQIMQKHGDIVGAFTQKLKNLAFYAGAAGLIYGGVQAIRTGLGESVQLESIMARIQGITGSKAPGTRYALQQGVIGAATQYGVNPLEAAGQLQTFVQAGFSPGESLKLTRASLLAQQGAGLSSEQASELLIAAHNISGGTVKAEDIINRISRVESTQAISAQELAEIIQRSGSIAMQLMPGRAGSVDAFDTLMGAGSVIKESTRMSGSQIATSLRFMMARLGNPEVLKNLQENFGIRFASNREGTQFRSLYDILNDLSRKYVELQSSGHTVAATQLATAFGGARQLQAVVPLLEKWNQAMETALDSSLAYGDAQRRLAIQMDTVAGRFQQTKNALFEFLNAFVQQSGLLDLIKRVLGGVTGSLQGASANPAHSLTKAAGGLGVGLTALSLLGLLIPGVGEVEGGMTLLQGLRLAGLRGAGLARSAGISSLLVAGGSRALEGYASANADRMAQEEFNAKYRMGAIVPISETDEVAMAYRQRAAGYGMTSSGLQSAVLSAAANARSRILARFGPNITSSDARVRDQFRGTYPLMEQAFTQELNKLIPGFSNVGDESQQAAEGLSLLADTLKRSNFVAGQVVGGYQEQTSGYLDQLQTAVLAGAQRTAFTGNAANQGYHAVDFGAAAQMAYDAKTGAPIGLRGGRASDFSLYGPSGPFLSYNYALAKSLYGANATGTVRRDVTGILDQMFGHVGTPLMLGANGQYLHSAGGTQSFADAIGNSLVYGGAQSLGRALDEWEKATLELTDAEQKLTGAARTEAEQRVAANRERFQKAVGLGLDIQFATGARKQALLDQQGNLLAPDASGGLAFFQAYQRAANGAIQSRLQGLSSADPRRQQLLQFERMLNSPEFRDRFRASVARQSGGAYVRDRILEVIGRYGMSVEEAMGAAGAFGRSGVGLNVGAERYQAAQQLVRGLYGARAQIRFDLMKARIKGSQYADTFSELETSLGDEGTAAMIPKNLQKLGQMVPGSTAVIRSMGQSERARLEEQAGLLQQSLQVLSTNQELFKGLDPEDREYIKALLGVNPKTPEGMAKIILNWKTIVSLAEKALTSEAERQQIFQRSLQVIQEQAQLASQGNTFAGERRGLGFQHAAALAQIYHQPGAALAAQLGEISSNRATAEREAYIQASARIAQRGAELEAAGVNPGTLAYQNEMAGIRADLSRSLDAARQRELIDRERLILHEQEAVLQERMARSEELVQGLTGGIRSQLAGGYKGVEHNFLGNTVDAAANAFSGRMADVFTDRLFGPEGVFGEALKNLFDNNLLLEGELITRSHILGITQGFAAVYGASAAAGTVNIGGITAPAPHAAALPGGGGAAGASRWRRLGDAALMMAGVVGGGAVGRGFGVGHGNNYGNEGASIGAMIGSLTPLGPVGGFIGGLVGGFVGGRIGRGKNEQPPELQALQLIERNTREQITAIENQTKALTLDNRLVNLPASFVVPSYRPFGSSAGGMAMGGVVIQVNGASDPEVVARKVAGVLQSQFGLYGTYTDTRF